MRDYGKIAPTFWTRGSGRLLRGHRDAQTVALYLMTCPSANMVGLYYLPLPTLCYEVGELDTQGASEALRRVAEAGIAFFDASCDMVWVPNMAARQIGEELDPRDKRRIGVIKDLESLGKHPFVRAFYERYAEPYGLRVPDWAKHHQAPSEPLRSQEQEQEQEQEKKNVRSSVLPSINREAPSDDSAHQRPLLEVGEPTRAADEQEVFAHWLGHWRRVINGKRSPALSTARAAAIRARLREGHSVADMKRAIDGLWADRWHVEHNHYGLELVCRNAETLGKWMDAAERPSGTVRTSMPARLGSGAPPAHDDDEASVAGFLDVDLDDEINGALRERVIS
jgi:hypothetical protein